jgi:hypothetical protein
VGAAGISKKAAKRAGQNRDGLLASTQKITYTCRISLRQQYRCATAEHTGPVKPSRPIEASIVADQFIFDFDLTNGNTWLTVGVGLGVAALVGLVAIIPYARWRVRLRRLALSSFEEDLPWHELLETLQARHQQQAAAGGPGDEELPTERLLQELLAALPSLPARRRGVADIDPEDWHLQAPLPEGDVEKRTSRRRWGNPVEVLLSWLGGSNRLHGVVINRSTGGLAIFVDKEIRDGTLFKIRAAEAPDYVPALAMQVRHCRKVGKSYILGCQFCGEVPWNVRVWFG